MSYLIVVELQQRFFPFSSTPPPPLPSTPPTGAHYLSGVDHLLYSAQTSETQVACFMGLLSFLASRPEVLRVSPMHGARIQNTVASSILQSATVAETPLQDAGLDGSGEIIQVSCRTLQVRYKWVQYSSSSAPCWQHIHVVYCRHASSLIASSCCCFFFFLFSSFFLARFYCSPVPS